MDSHSKLNRIILLPRFFSTMIQKFFRRLYRARKPDLFVRIDMNYWLMFLVLICIFLYL